MDLAKQSNGMQRLVQVAGQMQYPAQRNRFVGIARRIVLPHQQIAVQRLDDIQARPQRRFERKRHILAESARKPVLVILRQKNRQVDVMPCAAVVLISH